MSKKDASSNGNNIFLGLAFNNEDNHKRITSGENFCILGGSAKIHNTLVDKVLAFNEIIKKYGKKLEDLSEIEYYDIVKKVEKDNNITYWFYNS